MSCDPLEIRRALEVFTLPSHVYELRVMTPHRGTISGYFNEMNEMAKAAELWSGKGPAVYFLPNPVDPDLLARANNRAGTASITSSDSDVIRRNWYLIDFDAERKAGISASDEEHGLALGKARECWEWLQEKGFPRPLLADSGNGGHVCVRIDEPNDSETRDLLKAGLLALAQTFNATGVNCDPTTHNAARIWKLYGTLAAKGDPLPHRPHRLARLLETPSEALTSREKLIWLAGLVKPEKPRERARIAPSAQASPHSRGDYSTLDIVAWFQARGCYGHEHRPGMHTVDCPWKTEHTEQRPADHTDTVVYETDGTPGRWPQFKCQHAHCHDRGISEIIAFWGDADRFCSTLWAPPSPLQASFNKQSGLGELHEKAQELDDAARSLILQARQPNLSEITPLRIVLTDPPTYYPTVQGNELELSSVDFLEWRRFKTACVNRRQFMPILPEVPRGRGQEKLTPQQVWDEMIRLALVTAITEDAPPDAGEEGATWEAIVGFIRQQCRNSTPDHIDSEKALVGDYRVGSFDGFYHFKGQVLRSYLGRTNGTSLKPNDIWKVVRKHGGEETAIRPPKGKPVHCWRIPHRSVPEMQDE